MTPENPIRSIREQIADHIRSDIYSGELTEGDQLREEPLAQRFGVSRGPIRDVFLQLTQEGLLIQKPNSGVKVGAPPDESLQPLIVDLRLRIEVFALKKVFPLITEKNLQLLDSLVEKLRDACEKQDFALIAKHDMAFHHLLLSLTGDTDLIALWLPITARMMLHYTRYTDMMESHREHAAIVAAIREGDVEKAVQALITNVQ